VTTRSATFRQRPLAPHSSFTGVSYPPK
jgi:hypothetical protein